jgi:Flp pilus assembly protein TadD
LYKKHLYGQALSLLKESAEKLADNPVVHYHLGMAYYRQGDTAQARAALSQALQLRQDFVGAQEAQTVLASLS